MKRIFVPAFFLIFAASGLYAQAVNTTVCEVLKNPKAFDGKMVTIKGTVEAGFDQFVIKDAACGLEVNGIWLAYPQGSKAKAGPAVMVELAPAHNFAGTTAAAPRTPVTLTKDKAFKQFDSALAQVATVGGMCLGCVKNEAQATITGRLDGVDSASLKNDASGKIVGLGGFGNMNAYPARLVIASVADVTVLPVNVGPEGPGPNGEQPNQPHQSRASATTDAVTANSRTGAISTGNGTSATIENIASGVTENGKDAGNQPGSGPQTGQSTGPDTYPEQLAVLQKIAAAMKASPSPIGDQIQKDIALLPAPKEHGSVLIGNGAMDEVTANEGALGPIDSPDGLIYNCTMNHDKVSGTAAMVALTHIAQHIADVRAIATTKQSMPLIAMEDNAWVASVTIAATGGEKLLTLPGGYLIWNAAWPDANKSGNVQSALNKFLFNEEGLK